MKQNGPLGFVAYSLGLVMTATMLTTFAIIYDACRRCLAWFWWRPRIEEEPQQRLVLVKR